MGCARPTRARSPARFATGRSSLVLWAIVALLMVPFYMFSQRELAPSEDQGVVFSILQTSANSTLDQTKMFAEQVADVYRALPEAASIFQLTFPTGGFGGFVTKPWSERTKTTEQLLMEMAGPLSQIPGIRAIPLDAAAAAGRRRLPRGLRDCLAGGAGAAPRARRTSSSRRRSRAACSSLPTPT